MAINLALLKIQETAVIGLVGWLAGLISAGLIQQREQAESQHGILLTRRASAIRLITAPSYDAVLGGC